MAEMKTDKPGGWSWSWSAKKPEVVKGSVEQVIPAEGMDVKSCPTCGQRMGTINTEQAKQLKETKE